jgi:hypothetical protein
MVEFNARQRDGISILSIAIVVVVFALGIGIVAVVIGLRAHHLELTKSFKLTALFIIFCEVHCEKNVNASKFPREE